MVNNKEFEVRVYMNKTNFQYSLIPMKKKLSPEIIELMEDDNVVGFKLKIVKAFKKMPKSNIVVPLGEYHKLK